MNNIRIAIAHDWLTGMRGGEKCLEVFCELFPEATVFTLVHKKGSVSDTIESMDIRTSFIQKLPGGVSSYRNYLPFFTKAVESFDLSGYDMVLTSSHCVAKGVRSVPGALNICYCYTPVRYAWKFFDEYFGREKPLKRWFISRVIDGLRKWDLRSNSRIDHFIAISRTVRHRIKEFYGRGSDVIYPPVDVEAHGSDSVSDEGYYLVVSALVPYKRIDLAVEAFRRNGKRLVVIGSGNEENRLREMAPDNIEFRGWVGQEELRRCFRECTALIFPGEEDFGIVPVEAQAYGKPVIAYAAGGALETVVPAGREAALRGPTGVFFHDQEPESLNRAIGRMEASRDVFETSRIRQNAMRFDRNRFKSEIMDILAEKWEQHKKNGSL
jgi:glycosyltransferase involved in cell wall biosynthesis